MAEGYGVGVRAPQSLLALWQKNPRAMCCLQWRQGTFCVLDVNPAMEQQLALPLQTMLNRDIRELISSQTDHGAHYLQAIKTQQMVTFEDSVTFADGRSWFSIEVMPVSPGDAAAPQLLVTFVRKITEAALRQSEERFRSLFEGVPVIGMQVYDHQRRVIGWNQASEKLYGYTCAEAMGQTLEDLIIPDSMQAYVIQAVEDWLRHDIPIPPSELTLRHKSGKPVEVFSSHIMLTNLNGEPELYCLDLDISDLKQAEKNLRQAQLTMMHGEKMSSLGKMVAGIAHEINNPISFIDGNLDHAKDYVQELLHLVNLYQAAYPQPCPAIQSALAELDLDFMQADFSNLATSMQVGADRIRNIVDSLRDFSRLDEAGEKVVDIHRGLNSTLAILHHRLKTTEPAIEVVKKYSASTPILCYPGPLNQVFMNVLTNAIDALVNAALDGEILNGSSAPRIEISTVQPDSRQTVIYIRDNGPGMDDATKARMFDPFFTTKPVGRGTGMGLAISYQIITQQHHGQLLVESTPGQGTCVAIRLPMDLWQGF